jgi:hypothetical protein
LDAFLETADEVVLIVEEMFDYFSFYFAEEQEDRVVDGCQDHKNSHQFGPIRRNELNSRYQND